MKQIRPVYGQDYYPGTAIFTKKDGSILSEGVSWFQTLNEAVDFAPSHALIVWDKEYGIEADEKGIHKVLLSKYFDDPEYTVVCREPEGMYDHCARATIVYGGLLIGRPFDYTGFLLGFPLMLLTGLSKWIKPLRRLPVPFHIPKSRVCSALVADCYKQTTCYSDEKLFKEWHVSRITPVMLWSRFPFKPFRFDKRR